MSENDWPVVFSTVYGWMDGRRLQAAIADHDQPGIIFLFSQTWDESLTITQHNLSIIGMGAQSRISGSGGKATVSVLAPNVSLMNLSITAENSTAAIAFTDSDATQSHISNVRIEHSDGHGIYRDKGFNSALATVQNCYLSGIEGHGICVENGAGPQNILYNNTGEDIGKDFINWGANSSIFFNNHCSDASIRITEDSRYNCLINQPDDTKVIDEGKENQYINKMVDEKDAVN